MFFECSSGDSRCLREKIMRKHSLAAMAAGLVGLMPPAHASETITYTYDAKGRVVKVEHAGSVNNNLKAEYTHDKADNRKNLTVTGSPN